MADFSRISTLFTPGLTDRYICGRPRAHRTNPLDDGRLGPVHPALLERHDRQAAAPGIRELVRPQQEVRIRGPAVALVPLHEGLVDQYPAGREARGKRVEEGPVEIVRDHHA